MGAETVGTAIDITITAAQEETVEIETAESERVSERVSETAEMITDR